MAYTAETGNFEGRSRARGGFGNETGQTERRGRSGEAQAANRNAINRAATLSGPRGPFKSPVYDPSWQNLTKLAKTIGPMIANPGIGLVAPLAQSILSGDVYGAFGLPSGWSSYSPRDIDPMGSNPRGNIGGRDRDIGRSRLTAAQRNAILSEALRRQQARRPQAPTEASIQRQYFGPITLGDHVPGLPVYGTTRPGYDAPMPGKGKAAGYGGTARLAPIAYPATYR